MPRSNKFYLFLLGFFFLMLPQISFSSHLKGGEITVKRISEKSLTFEFTLITYTENNRANAEQNEVNFCFGDGSGIFKAPRCCGTPVDIGNGTMKNIYKITYTYPAPALSYKVSVAIPNRNDGVRNISSSASVSFYVETTFSTNSGLGLNTTPIFLNPAVDLTAQVGQLYIHNPNAIDIEGDSLAYRMSVSKFGNQDKCGDANRGQVAPGFVQPNESSALPSSFTIDPYLGDLKWDVPREVGRYNCAFIVEEWRNGIKISETVRDMQIEVRDMNNSRPILTIPEDVCVTAGERIESTITAIDQPSPSGGRLDFLTISSSSNIYDQEGDNNNFISPAYASFKANERQESPASGVFSWQTDCIHIRKAPYDVLFKVLDLPPVTIEGVVSLVDSKIWHIRVQAPAPKGLKTKVLGPNDGVEISWEDYSCNLLNAKMQIYRKIGDCEELNPQPCSSGQIPEGFVKIGEADLADGKLIDNNNLTKLENYVYIGIIQFTNSSGVKDYTPISNTACALIPTVAPLMTQVSVQETDRESGEILVSWSVPRNFDQASIPGPYYYQVLRAVGVGNTNFETVTELLPADLSGVKNDTTFIDRGLNTFDKVTYYKVNFYHTSSGGISLVDGSSQARNVYLVGKTDTDAISLNWFTDTPWSNEFQVHRIYREKTPGSNEFNRIANVSVGNRSTFRFTDTGEDAFAEDGTFSVKIQPDSTYCYYVETVGEYGEGYPDFTLINASQKICFKAVSGGTGGNDGGLNPGDGGSGGGGGGTNLDPCTPLLNSVQTDCDKLDEDQDCVFNNFTNRLSWSLQKSSDCDTSIVNYTIHYARADSLDYSIIETINAKSFSHVKPNQIQGCYYIKAISGTGKLSQASNRICVENCPKFDLPNVFSPNGDGYNDRFLPLRCPRFVEQVKAKIVDRYGQLVYEYEGDLSGFGWDGTNLKGQSVASSTYFYEVEVLFTNAVNSQRNKSMKGWVELIK